MRKERQGGLFWPRSPLRSLDWKKARMRKTFSAPEDGAASHWPRTLTLRSLAAKGPLPLCPKADSLGGTCEAGRGLAWPPSHSHLEE